MQCATMTLLVTLGTPILSLQESVSVQETFKDSTPIHFMTKSQSPDREVRTMPEEQAPELPEYHPSSLEGLSLSSPEEGISPALDYFK